LLPGINGHIGDALQWPHGCGERHAQLLKRLEAHVSDKQHDSEGDEKQQPGYWGWASLEKRWRLMAGNGHHVGACFRWCFKS
jgi:hypothetical protein